MLAVVKKPHIEISAEEIPKKLMNFLKANFETVEVIDNDDELIDISETDWYKELASEKSIGSTLRRYRKRAGLSQSELAEKVGMVKQNISAMENGSRGISKSTARKLGEIFHVSPGRFI